MTSRYGLLQRLPAVGPLPPPAQTCLRVIWPLPYLLIPCSPNHCVYQLNTHPLSSHPLLSCIHVPLRLCAHDPAQASTHPNGARSSACKPAPQWPLGRETLGKAPTAPGLTCPKHRKEAWPPGPVGAASWGRADHPLRCSTGGVRPLPTANQSVLHARIITSSRTPHLPQSVSRIMAELPHGAWGTQEVKFLE